jgi:ATP-dependent DNA helicase RecQ
MARNYPESENDFARISGVGEKKLREFGEVFLNEIALHLATNPRQIFADDSFTAPQPIRKTSLNDTTRETLRRFRAGESVEQIAAARGFAASTIYGHLAAAIEAGENIDVNELLDAEAQEQIAAAFKKFGFGNIGGARESLGNNLITACSGFSARRTRKNLKIIFSPPFSTSAHSCPCQNQSKPS